MNNRQARLFAIGSTAFAAILFLGMTLDSHRQFPTLTNADKITPEVIHGKDVWHKYNCINCHTLFGEGAYYAPDLTKITQHRGEAYLHAYMRDPSKFYDENKHRRLMPKQDLSEKEIVDLVTFLGWVSEVDNQDWPPRPILVTGGFSQAASAGPSGTEASATTAGSGSDPRALGEQLFSTAVPTCKACHSLTPGADGAGPSLAGIVTRTEQLLASDEYQGEAKDVEAYLHESIVQPSAHLVPGAMYSAGGTSFMPIGYADSLTAEQVDQLVAFLATLK
ncbi:c-type cytochrome [Oceanisphaera sp. IT1-181]|uniref:c-type cytochrome n=1 Tax=Oceanisphaera sp. IT1-181 TaxID=3081199 RepID=UPI0029CA73D1|nr:c-type cytochrome [Oceanisphaera sp. IT1-181]